MPDAEILKLIERAKQIKVTPKLLADHRRSFVYGNTKIENDLITFEMVSAVEARLYPKKS